MQVARLARAVRRVPSVDGYAQRRRLSCYCLEGRGLLRIQGPDTEIFLQGLVTNDVKRMRSEDRRAVYSHLLNVQGRTLFDVIIYRLGRSPEEELDVLLECDSSVLDSVQKHLKVYKIRRKVSLVPCSDLTLWAVLPDDSSEDVPAAFQSCTGPSTILTPDPRVAAMGWRLVTSKDQSLPETQKIGSIKEYHKFRYRKGVPEGVRDLPPGVALPLESNLEYMHGISFSKGCFIGQELTARTHHTGVIRKRLVPVQLSQPLPSDVQAIPSGADISTGSGKSAGKYRAGEEETGLALLRLAHMKEPLHVKISNTTVSLSTAVPEWWPEIDIL